MNTLFKVAFVVVLVCCTVAMAFAGHGPGSLTDNPAGSPVFHPYNPTHISIVAGTTGTFYIMNATDVVGQTTVPVFVKSSNFGNTQVTGTVSGSTITFQWTAPIDGCNTTNVAYGSLGNGANNFLISGGGSAAGIALVDANGNPITTCNTVQCPNALTTTGGVADCNDNHTVQLSVSLVGVDSATAANSTHSWSGPGIIQDGNTATPFVNLTNEAHLLDTYTATYTVTVTPPNCAPLTGTADVTVGPVCFNPLACSVTDPQTVCEGGSVTFTATPIEGLAPYHYSWVKSTDPLTVLGTGQSFTINPVQLSDAGRYVVTISDTAGENSSCVTSLAVNPKATISFLPENTTVECGSSTDPSATGTATSDNGTISFADVVTPGNCGGNYSIARTWTATNDCGSASGVQTITVHDTQAPTLSGMPDSLVNVQCYGDVPAPATLTASDICQGSVEVSYGASESKQGSSCDNTITRTWTATDACGNSASYKQTIHVNDTTPPTIGEAGASATLECPATPSFTAPTASDNCDANPSVFVVSDTTIHSCGSSYTRTIVWAAKDACGNTSGTKSQTITVEDKTAPVLSGMPDASASFQCYGDVPAPANVSANDACQGNTEVIYSARETNQGSSCNNTITRTWTATDACGNSSSFTQTIQVNDTQAPVITAISNITVGADSGQCCAKVSFSTSATDNCDLNPGITYSPASGTCFNVGTTTVTITATDACGNQSTSTFTVTVTSSISGMKFYDANKNGVKDAGEVGIAGWKIVLSGAGSFTAFTDANGNYTFSGLGAGTYTVTEVIPPAGTGSNSWTNVTPLSKTVTLGCSQTVNFGNVCVTTPGGHTKGFWHNAGCKLITHADVVALDNFCLVKINGTPYDPSQASGCNKEFSDFLTNNSNASNMACQLSAQMTATYLSTQHGFTIGTVIVDGTRDVNAEINYANSLLCQSGGNLTVTSSALRTEQGRVMSILDKVNNGGSFAQGTSCGVSYATSSSRTSGGAAGRKAIADPTNSNSVTPTTYALLGNYPNPFNPTTNIAYDLPEGGQVTLKIYDVLGREVASLVNGVQSAGHYVAQFDGSSLSNGVYFYRLQAGSFTATKSLLLMK